MKPRFSRHGDSSQCVLQQYGCPLSVQPGRPICSFVSSVVGHRLAGSIEIYINKVDYDENQRAFAKHDITTIIHV